MKRNWVGILFFMWLMGFRVSVFGQTTEAMLQQIAALQGYIRTAEKGYQIAEQGIATVREIKNGEFSLHSIFFSSLRAVNPAVKNMGQTGEILSLQISMIENYAQSLHAWQQSPWLQPAELSNMEDIYANLVTTSQKEANSLSDLTTDGKLQMEDGERMRRVESLNEEMKTQQANIQDYIDGTNLLIRQRQQEAGNIIMSKNMYGLQ